VDGEGTALVTEECLLNPNRNPRCERSDIEQRLREYLGVDQIIWLGRGVVNDETSGHIDELACFVRPGVVCLTWTDRRRDPQYAVSLDAFERLQQARDARGRRLEVVRLPMPGPLHMRAREAAGVIPKEGSRPRVAGERLAASYVNFYIANGGIVMPLLDARTDALAATRLKRLFPRRRVVGVPTREILLGGGNIHCITQQIPSGTRSRSPSAR
jgi:agmatine deiminase